MYPEVVVMVVAVIVEAVIWLAAVVPEMSTPPPTVRFPETHPVVVWRVPTVAVVNVSSLSCFVANPATSELTVARTSKASFNPAVFAMVSDPSAMVGVAISVSISLLL
jgi:hypothetical protein